jgi:hypothetical protein
VRRLLITAVTFAAVAAVAGVAASASPDRWTQCEAATGVDRGQVNCLGTLPPSHRRVVLRSRNGSSERGVAFVTFGHHQTKVTISLIGAPPGVRQPAHISKGGCLGRIVARLGSVVSGKRLTKVAPLAHFSGLAVVIHASTAEGAAVVECGVIPRHHR